MYEGECLMSRGGVGWGGWWVVGGRGRMIGVVCGCERGVHIVGAQKNEMCASCGVPTRIIRERAVGVGYLRTGHAKARMCVAVLGPTLAYRLCWVTHIMRSLCTLLSVQKRRIPSRFPSRNQFCAVPM